MTFCEQLSNKCNFLFTRVFPAVRRVLSIKLSSHHDFNQIQFNAPLNPVLIGWPDALINYARPQFSRSSIGRKFILAGRRAHAKHFFLLFSARLRPRQWTPLHYLSGIFGVCARVEIYTSAQENNQIPIRARVSNKMRELLFKTPERDDRSFVVCGYVRLWKLLERLYCGLGFLIIALD